MTVGTNGNGRVGLWVSIVVAGASVIGMIGGMFYVAFSTKANTEALSAQMVVNAQLNSEIRSVQLKQNSLEVALNEVETQFCAQDIVRNLMHASDMRSIAMLWQKAFSERVPTDNAYYPTICNRKTKQ